MGTTFGTPTQSMGALRTLLGRSDEQNQCWLVLVKPKFLQEGKPSVIFCMRENLQFQFFNL
jgi:hypothetical protein